MNVSCLIAAFVADLMFQTRIAGVADNLNVQVMWFESEEKVISTDLDSLAELGPVSILVDKLTRQGVKLLIFDLGNMEIQWPDWITILKRVPATRRIPVICFGSHVNVNMLKKARRIGVDDVLARSLFITILPELIQKYTQNINTEFLIETCAEPLHSDAVIGLKLFNQGDYFMAHEYLEEAWKDDLTIGRNLYQGLLQVAVAYYHIEQANFQGMVKMFQRARHWLYPLPDTCRGIDVAQFREDAFMIYDQVLSLGANRMKEFPIEKLKPVIWKLY